jgi:hypothetical protein
MIYINQRTNYGWEGKLSPSRQCFYSSAVMLLSHYDKAAKDLEYLIQYVDDTEILVGKPGIAERLFPKLTGRTGAYWAVHRAAIQERLKKEVVFDATMPYEVMKNIVAEKPVIIGTKEIGALSGGHIIVAMRISEKGIIVNDPYGNALTKYKDHNGNGIDYPDDYLKKYFSNHVIYVR